MRNRARHFVVPVVLAMLATIAGVSASSAADHVSLPAIVPTTATPNINDASKNVV